jgi:hypothetical protein
VKVVVKIVSQGESGLICDPRFMDCPNPWIFPESMDYFR